MRRKLIQLIRLVNPPHQESPKEPVEIENDFARQMLAAWIAKLKDGNTFNDLAEITGFTHEYFRKPLTELHRRNPKAVVKIGKTYRVPPATAESFLTSLLS